MRDGNTVEEPSLLHRYDRDKHHPYPATIREDHVREGQHIQEEQWQTGSKVLKEKNRAKLMNRDSTLVQETTRISSCTVDLQTFFGRLRGLLKWLLARPVSLRIMALRK